VRTIAKIPTHFRVWIANFGLSEEELGSRSEVFLFRRLFPESKIPNRKSKIHLIIRSTLARRFGGMVNPICFASYCAAQPEPHSQIVVFIDSVLKGAKLGEERKQRNREGH
jgi:hypothetical protein